MGLRPTQGDEKRLLFSNYSPWKGRPPFCHLDRSAAKWRDLCVDALSWKCFSTGGSWAFGLPKVMKNGSYSATTLPGRTALPFVISTEAYPDFLLRAAGNDHVCGFPKENRMMLINATGLHRKSGGAQWRDLRFGGSFLEMFFDRALRKKSKGRDCRSSEAWSRSF